MNRRDANAIIYEDRSLTYEQLLHQVKRYGWMLESLGIGSGERVAIAASDCPGWIISFLGITAAGAVAVPLSTMLSAAELQYVLKHCGAKALLISSEQLEKLNSIKAGLEQLETVLLIEGQADGVLSLEPLLAGASEAEIKQVDDGELAFILYTSGSTGPPKGAMHLHRNLPYTVNTCCKQTLCVEPEDRLFSSSRLFFAYGLGNSLSFPLGSGATTILCKEKPTPPVIARIFKDHRPTIFFSVPAVFRALIEYAASGQTLETASIKFCVSAGEKLPETVFDEWRRLTGLDILDGIGSTEMLQMFISNSREGLRPGSSGRIVPGYQAKLLDEQGREVGDEVAGHLFVKGGSASPGYWNDAQKTAATMQGEWMRTGDIYRRDADGYFWFEGRSDDLFKVKGLWVSPVEIEEALLSCDGVLEAAVVPGVNEHGMNTVTAYVVLRTQPLSEDEAVADLKREAAQRLPPYKSPSAIYLTDALPRTATGKLQRFKLRARTP